MFNIPHMKINPGKFGTAHWDIQMFKCFTEEQLRANSGRMNILRPNLVLGRD